MSSYKNPITIISWNATSVKSKMTKLHKFFIGHNADIAISEMAWLTPKDTIKLFNYKIHRYDGPPSATINQEVEY